MQAVFTILSISFLLLISSIFAGDSKVYNELPDEIKNIHKKKTLMPVRVHYRSDTMKTDNKLSSLTSTVVKLKFRKRGRVDTAVVVYCEEPNVGFEQIALQTVLKSTLPSKKSRRRDKSWYYIEVVFDQLDYKKRAESDSSRSPLDISKQRDPVVEIMPEMIYKSVPKYPLLARQRGAEETVFLRVLIGITGRPLDVVIIKSADPKGKYGFDEVAM